MPSIARPWWIVDLTLLTGLAALAGLAISQSLAARIHSLPSAAEAVPPAALDSDPIDPAGWASRIIERNIFDSTPPAPEPPEAPGAPESPALSGPPGPATPCEPAAGFKLLATMVAEPEAESRAVVQSADRRDGRRRIVRPGARLDGGVVTAIYRQRAVLRRGGEHTCLELGAEPPRSTTSTPAPRPGSRGSKGPAGLVRKVGEGRFVIDEAGFRALLDNPRSVGRDIRIRPHSRSGKPAGFKVSRVRRGGFFEALGLQRNDILIGVNGETVDSPTRALELYDELRTARSATLELQRRGRPIVVEYTLR